MPSRRHRPFRVICSSVTGLSVPTATTLHSGATAPIDVLGPAPMVAHPSSTRVSLPSASMPPFPCFVRVFLHDDQLVRGTFVMYDQAKSPVRHDCVVGVGVRVTRKFRVG
jgi:hypothetical protein